MPPEAAPWPPPGAVAAPCCAPLVQFSGPRAGPLSPVSLSHRPHVTAAVEGAPQIRSIAASGIAAVCRMRRSQLPEAPGVADAGRTKLLSHQPSTSAYLQPILAKLFSGSCAGPLTPL